MADAVGNEHVYLPLQQGQIRLMKTRHSASGAIHCELGTFSISEKPNYMALSYCWTKADPTCEIRLNGQPFWVRPNLHAYLTIMRDEGQACWIFIDALCINQDDVAERGAQVKLMPKVYQDAEEVVVWLGNASVPQLKFVGPDAFENLETSLQRSEEPLEENFLSMSSFKDYPYVCTLEALLFQPEYWSRTWIVQEFILARRLTLQINRIRMMTDQLESAIRFVSNYYELTGTLNRASKSTFDWSSSTTGLIASTSKTKQKTWLANMSFAQLLMNIRKQSDPTSEALPRRTLLDTIINCSGQSCSEVRDKVFGLLGLANSQLEPNYEMSRLELFLRVYTEAIIEKTRIDKLKYVTEDRYASRPAEGMLGAELLYQLRLNPYDPATAITTRNILACCEQRLGSGRPETIESNMYSIRRYFLSIWLREELNLPRLSRWVRIAPKAFIGFFWLISKSKATRAQLSKWRDRCPAPSHAFGELRTVKDWKDWANELFDDIADKGEAILQEQLMSKLVELHDEIRNIRNRLDGSNSNEKQQFVLNHVEEAIKLIHTCNAECSDNDKGALFMLCTETCAENMSLLQEWDSKSRKIVTLRARFKALRAEPAGSSPRVPSDHV